MLLFQDYVIVWILFYITVSQLGGTNRLIKNNHNHTFDFVKRIFRINRTYPLDAMKSDEARKLFVKIKFGRNYLSNTRSSPSRHE